MLAMGIEDAEVVKIGASANRDSGEILLGNYSILHLYCIGLTFTEKKVNILRPTR
jgi:hypothetical protein